MDLCDGAIPPQVEAYPDLNSLCLLAAGRSVVVAHEVPPHLCMAHHDRGARLQRGIHHHDFDLADPDVASRTSVAIEVDQASKKFLMVGPREGPRKGR